MALLPHTAIYTDLASQKQAFAKNLLQGVYPESLGFLKGMKGAYFSNHHIEALIEEEARHDRSAVNPDAARSFRTFSSGERKKALLDHLLEQEPDYLLLDDPFDNLDQGFQRALQHRLKELSRTTLLLQLVSRREDVLPYIDNFAKLEGDQLLGFPNYHPVSSDDPAPLNGRIPGPPIPNSELPDPLVSFNGVCVHYGGRPILKNIHWTIARGDFWELRGPNGSGKTTLITMVTGDNPKAYGQPIELFGRPKGSGESVWDIKARIGYFTPAMTDRFRGYHSVRNMVVSGLVDSVGLYTQPTEAQDRLATRWLDLIGLASRAGVRFSDLNAGAQRLVLCARAMIKHPPLLILDEPTAGLDDASARLVVALIEKMASESETAIVFVSHRAEKGLRAEHVLELIPGPQGSTARIF